MTPDWSTLKPLGIGLPPQQVAPQCTLKVLPQLRESLLLCEKHLFFVSSCQHPAESLNSPRRVVSMCSAHMNAAASLRHTVEFIASRTWEGRWCLHTKGQGHTTAPALQRSRNVFVPFFPPNPYSSSLLCGVYIKCQLYFRSIRN